MADPQILSVIRIWAAMAWADGVLADAEAAAMRRLIENAGLAEDDRATASRWLDAKVELDPSGLGELSPESRAGIYRAACRLAVIDREIADSERSVLLRLREALGLSADQARDIEASVPGVTV